MVLVLEVLETAPGEKLPIRTVIVGGIENPLVTDQEGTTVGRLFSVEQIHGRQVFLSIGEFALVPEVGNRRHDAPGSEFSARRCPSWEGFLIDGAMIQGFNTQRMTQLECHECQVRRMTAHVTNGSRAEIPPTTPFEGVVGVVVRTIGCWAEKKIPIHMVWNSHGFRGSCRDGRRLRPDRSVGPNVYFSHGTNSS